MLIDEELLTKVKKLIEARLSWGDSADWTNQDFIALSTRFQEEMNLSVSHVTLKRIWGKLSYHSLPQSYTLNALAKFAGYESWRNFKVNTELDMHIPESLSVFPESSRQRATDPVQKKRLGILIKIGFTSIFIIAVIVLIFQRSKNKIAPSDYSLSVHKVLQAGLPNSVIFDYNANKSPSDSVILQQSWDNRLRTTVPKDQHQHTLIYYYPGFFKPKLIVDGQIVKEQDLLIQSDGWMTAVNASPVPVYFNKKDVIANGKMALSVDQLKAQNIPLSPQPPMLSYCNVQDFGEIYADHFVFETSLRSDYHEGASVCQMTNIYLLCEGTAIGIPLCAKGCESNIKFFFTGFEVSGKQQDLSGFGVDFSDFVKLRVESRNGRARIFLNDRLTQEVNKDISRSKIIGIDFVFQGTGSVDYVKLTNGKVFFDDEF
jgi:hypothetical protein